MVAGNLTRLPFRGIILNSSASYLLTDLFPCVGRFSALTQSCRSVAQPVQASRGTTIGDGDVYA